MLPVADTLDFARSFQLEALKKAIKQNTIAFFETGTGKTLIAVMLLRSYACFLREPSQYFAVFLVPTVVLVNQQSEVIATLTDLKVGKYYGEMGVDFWDSATWKQETGNHEVLVMTPQILLNALRHSFLRIDQIKVLIFDECHNAKGKHPYACIMKEFYHHEFKSNSLECPRIFGMTASPIKAKAFGPAAGYWKSISLIENILDSKVFTCESDSDIARYIPIPTLKVRTYNHVELPSLMISFLMNELFKLVKKHEAALKNTTTSESLKCSTQKRLNKLLSTLRFCLFELGVWLALKATEVYSFEEDDSFLSFKMATYTEEVVRSFLLDAAKIFSETVPSDLKWATSDDLKSSCKAGFLNSRVLCLVETLLECREVKDLRCIIFVERVVSAIVICTFLNKILPAFCGWRTEYTAGNNSKLQTQSRKKQSTIVDEFRKGTVNIIVATSMLEEGLDVQSCNLVIRFDPSNTICSFIQSRGRARMQNSDFIILVKRGDSSALSHVQDCVEGVGIMRRECLRHSDLPCEPIDEDMCDELRYCVERTGAIVTLSSSVSLIYFYCSRLPSDGYFKPFPRFIIDKEARNCTLYLPNSCPIQVVTVEDKPKLLKQHACLEACKELHRVGALTDNLIPDIVEEEADIQESGVEQFLDECAIYVPPELVGVCGGEDLRSYQCYLIELQSEFEYVKKLRNIVLVVNSKLDSDIENLSLDGMKGQLIVRMKHIGGVQLSPQQVDICQKFQIKIFRILFDHNLDRLEEELDQYSKRKGSIVFNYLLLPSICGRPNISFDWECISACVYLKNVCSAGHNCSFSPKGSVNYVHVKNASICRCVLENSLVCTPHNGRLYCIVGSLEGYDGSSHLKLRDGREVTYEKYYKEKYGIKLQHKQENLLKAKRLCIVQNYLQKSSAPSSKELTNTVCELPPELCVVIMSPISASTFYSFSFLPSIMHRIESFLVASNLKAIHAEQWGQNVTISTSRILEAITTKKCQENFHLESLEALGDSFLKYAVSQQLFCSYQNQHEGILSIRRSRIASNASLCKLGCSAEIAGFIRNEPFDPKKWAVPGSYCIQYVLKNEAIVSGTMYYRGIRKIKSKTVADVVEALIGGYLLDGGEIAALSFLAWLGITVNFTSVPYIRKFPVNPESHVNVKYLQSLLKYTFRDATLLVEALTHGSYMLPGIPGCYQRLEFLGDAVLDYLISIHLYKKHPKLSPGLLSDLRSASVNNDCYARSALRLGLYKHILFCSSELKDQIVKAAVSFDESDALPIFGWDSEASFPKVLGDVIESIAGALLVDSEYNKDVVFQSMRPLLEPLVTPETLPLHPVRELTELCQTMHYNMKKVEFQLQNQKVYATVEVEAEGGVLHREIRCGANRKAAKRVASRAVLKSLQTALERQMQ